jgi:hypothetical protein
MWHYKKETLNTNPSNFSRFIISWGYILEFKNANIHYSIAPRFAAMKQDD